ncbi:MAG TPA: serine/threonine-protein kinase [Chloroflexia bacterium]|nr:serine/threonine-protein kinase [Chloroflexia bacterium]
MRGAFCPHCGSPTRPQARFCAGCGSLLAAGGGVLGIGAPLHGGRYRVARLLGRGGNGAVYLVEDTRLGRACVAKELQGHFPSAADRRRAHADFQREALILARLSTEHPGLPQTYDFFAEGERHYLVMQYVAGQDLDSRLRTGGPLAEAEAVAYGAAAADVLAFLHAQQPDPVIHRDVKPANLIIDGQARVKLVDFGLAKALPSTTQRLAASLPGETGAAGTAGYTPLEQWALQAEARSDIYALGATLHHLLTGRDPRAGFAKHTELNLDVLRRLTTFPPVRTLRADLSPALDTLIMRMLAAEPAGRPPAAEVQAHLAGLLKPGRSRVSPRPVRRPAAAAGEERVLAVPLLAPAALADAALAWMRAHLAGLPPAEPIRLISAQAVLVPMALGSYTLAARFTAPGGQLLHELQEHGTCVLDGSGQPVDAALTALVTAARPALIACAPAGLGAQVVPFRLDALRLRDALLSLLIAQYTREVPYRGANGRQYTRVCKPLRKEIQLVGGGPVLLHQPRWTLRVAVRGREYTFEAYQGAPGGAGPPLVVVGDSLAGTHFCPGCGRLLPAAQMVACTACGRSVCQACAVHRSRLGLFHKQFCSTRCAESFAASGPVGRWL